VVRYDVRNFARRFRAAIAWMLDEADCGSFLTQEVRRFKSNRDCLKANPDAHCALRLAVELVVSGGRRRRPRRMAEKIDRFLGEFGKDFRRTPAQHRLEKLFSGGRQRRGGTQQTKLRRLLAEYGSMRAFTAKQDELAKTGGTEILGEKGRDNYLRDFGHWDRIPIDRHEMRFLVRTGIYHACGTRDHADHLVNDDLHRALTTFCSKFLSGFTVDDIDLGNAPGIVDLFIWTFCANPETSRHGLGICGAIPKCRGCRLASTCLFALTSPE
jgi:hypothetical protein